MAQLHERSDAEDVCQDAFFQGWQRIDECREPAKFAAWLLRIVRNTAQNRREYLAVRSAGSLEDNPTASTAPTPDVILDRRELGRRLWRALRTLTPTEREIVLLHDLDGCRHAGIAAKLEISELMSRRRLSDARKRLREILGD